VPLNIFVNSKSIPLLLNFKYHNLYIDRLKLNRIRYKKLINYTSEQFSVGLKSEYDLEVVNNLNKINEIDIELEKLMIKEEIINMNLDIEKEG